MAAAGGRVTNVAGTATDVDLGLDRAKFGMTGRTRGVKASAKTG